MSESREDIEARIAAYIDGELPPAEAARLEVFLANTDPQLAEQVIGMLADKHRLRTLRPVKAPGDLAARIMEQVERSSLLNGVEHFANPQRPWWQSRGFIAAITILVVGGFSYFLVTSILPGGSAWKNSLASSESTTPSAARPAVATPRPEMDKSGLAEKTLADDGRIASAAPPAAVHDSLGPAGGGGGVRRGVDSAAPAFEGKMAEGRVAVAPAAPMPAKDNAEFNTKTADAPVAIAGKNGLAAGNGGEGGGFGGQSKIAGGALALSNGSNGSTDDIVQSQINRNRELLDSKSADVTKLGYIPTVSARKAIDALAPATVAANTESSKFTSDQPIVLAFVARDSEDTTRFQSRLEQLISQDDVSARNQLAVQNKVRGMSVRANEAAANAAQTNDSSADGNYRFYNDRDRSFSNNAPVNGTETDSANGITPNKAINQNNGQQFGMQQQTLQPAAASPAPYRVALTPDELHTLSHEFELRAASRGEAAYAITPAPTSALADQKLKVTDAGGVVDERLAGTTSQPAAAASVAPSNGDDLKNTDTLQKRADDQQASQAKSSPQLRQQQEKQPAALDCIITIEPAK